MMALMAKFGLEGYGAFFILTEICAKKLEKRADEEYADEHLNFIFNERLVREKLRMRATKVELFLNFCATLDLLLFTKVEDEFHISFPKLLESMDRDSKRARHCRVTAAPKRKKKEKEEDKEKDISARTPKQVETDSGKVLRDAIRGVYRTAYARRYGVEKETFNQRENSQIQELAKRLGQDAPGVVAFYFNHDDQFYVRQSHALGPLLANAEALQTQWKTKVAVTTHHAREIERSQSSAISEGEMATLLGRSDEPRLVAPVQELFPLLKVGGDHD